MRFYLLPLAALALAATTFSAAAQASRPLTIGRIVRQSPALDQVLAPGAQLEVISSGHAHVEGPLWVPDSSMLLFSDTKTRTIYRWRAADSKRSKFLEYSGYTGRLPYQEEPGSNGLALDGRGNLLICEHGDRRLASLPLGQDTGGKRTVADNFQGKRLNSPNDVIAAPDDALYFTDPPFGLPKENPRRELPYTSVFRRAADGQLTAEITDVPYANGIALSPDNRTLYVSNADSLRPLIFAYEVGKNGKLSKPRPFFDMSSLPRAHFKEVPDGLKVDQDGNVYAAGFGGLLILSPQGRLLGTIDPGEVVSNAAWGDDGHSLYLMATTFVCRIKTLARGVPGR